MHCIANSELTYLLFSKFPCLSQAVECAVLIISEVSRKKRTDGVTKNKHMSRKEMPKINQEKTQKAILDIKTNILRK